MKASKKDFKEILPMGFFKSYKKLLRALPSKEEFVNFQEPNALNHFEKMILSIEADITPEKLVQELNLAFNVLSVNNYKDVITPICILADKTFRANEHNIPFAYPEYMKREIDTYVELIDFNKCIILATEDEVSCGKILDEMHEKRKVAELVEAIHKGLEYYANKYNRKLPLNEVELIEKENEALNKLINHIEKEINS